MRYTDEMAERAERAVKEGYPELWVGLDFAKVEGVVQTVLVAATARDHEHLKQQLPVTAVSAALPPDTELIEFLLVGPAGRFWEFELGPVASGSLVLLLTQALEEVEQRAQGKSPR